MGGPIGVTVRLEDGTVESIEAWTNPLPWFIDNDRFYNRDKKHITDYLESYKDDKMDVIPTGYGIVVLDLETKTILSHQGYTHFGCISFVSIALENGTTKIVYEHENNHSNIFKRLFEQGMITSYSDFDRSVDGWVKETHSLKGKSLGEVEVILLEHMNAKESMGGTEFIIDTGWEIIDYDETSAGLEALKLKMIELGFVFNLSDEKNWTEYINEQYEDDEE